MSTVTFAKGGGKSGGGIVGAVLDAVAGAAGGGGCGNGTVSGKRGFQKGNQCGKGRASGTAANKASGAHRSARAGVSKHIKANTLHSKEGRASVRAAAAAHRELQAARTAQASAKTGVAKSARAVASGRASALPATKATAKPSTETAAKTPVHARVEASAKESSTLKADRAAQHLKDLHEGAKAGAFKATDIHAHTERIARGTTKDELFAAAKAAGVEHKATTKKALVEHLKAHAHEATKPETAKASIGTKDFAARVVSGAHASPTGGFGDSKTFISHAKAHLDKTDPAIKAMSDSQFKAKLLEAHKEGHLELGRADLTGSMNHADVKASSTPHMGAEYHFVRHPAKAESPAPKAAAPKPDKAPQAAKAKPVAKPAAKAPEKAKPSGPSASKPAATTAGHDRNQVMHRMEQAFNKHDTRGENNVTIDKLRSELPDVPRHEFDAAFRQHQVEGRFTIDSHEGLRKPATQAMKDAAILHPARGEGERPTMLIHVSRRQAKP